MCGGESEFEAIVGRSGRLVMMSPSSGASDYRGPMTRGLMRRSRSSYVCLSVRAHPEILLSCTYIQSARDPAAIR